ncbi:MAG: glycoside hydrolase domain-containing protein, partial [Gemmatimonadaceae bacterium]
MTDDTIAHHGDDDPFRMTRLRWLNSQLAADDSVVAPFTAMTVSGSTIGVLGRTLTFGNDGLPTSIKSFFAPDVTRLTSEGREVLSAPIQLVIRTGSAAPVWRGEAARVTERATGGGAVAWEATRTAAALTLHLRAQMEFDGTTEFETTLIATDSVRLSDVRLEIPMLGDAAKYMMGLGEKGGRRPREVHWVWDVAKKNQDAAWLGDVNAGLQFTLKDEHYVRPLNTNFYLSKPLILPTSWGNGGLGGCDVTAAAAAARPGTATAAATSGERVLVSCFSGARTMQKGDSLRFDFRLMISPFKPLDTQGQWRTRYFHAFVPVDSIEARGANTVNVHHANRVNPWINYPFLEPAQMKAYIDSAHAKKMQVKIYYTVRELTNHTPELFALRSLGDEVLSHGPGGGYSWLQEHLGSDYIAAWHVPEIKDAAIINSGVSRWHNFYVEGLSWLVKNVGIDGLYIDDVAFDRTTMKRVRKVLDRDNPRALIDLHSANQYNPRDGFASSANLYLEHFPFLNRLWFGEYFDYDSKPDYWLVELSGIPFGLMSEMLEKGGNPWRGMTFGMTNRMPWSGDPSPIWKAWDDFGMEQSRMIGWWSPAAPVKTGNEDVLATTYVRAGKALVALASWAPESVNVKLTI